MPTFKLPLSGDVLQAVNPWTVFISPIGSQMGLFNVSIGQSSEPAVEAEVLSDVASYGKQLGRVGDALVVLLNHFHPRTPLTEEETAAIDDLKDMLARIADVKGKHKRKALRPSAHQAPSPDQPPVPIASPEPPPCPLLRAGEGKEGAALGANASAPTPTTPTPITTPRRAPRSPPRRPS